MPGQPVLAENVISGKAPEGAGSVQASTADFRTETSRLTTLQKQFERQQWRIKNARAACFHVSQELLDGTRIWAQESLDQEPTKKSCLDAGEV